MIERIGKYEVRAELGRGGMGRVYRAYDPSLDHDVAIKVLTSEGDPDLLGRFRSEAGTTAKLNHKNIITVHNFGEQDGMPYLVMELLNGEDLAHVIREHKPLTLLDKVRIMYQVAEGLSFAHQNSVVHRDIKPANIMLLPDGSVKIMDFGIARVTSRNSTRRTQKGFMLGTISYMAPEQFRLGTDADQLVDIFAYGDVFYELITGVHPFHADDPGTVMYRITAVEPMPVRELAPECPDSLAYIIHQLLAKDRDLRYQSLRDAMLDIEPTLFELRQQRAEQILVDVHHIIEEGRLDTALIKVKEALELDPMSRGARQLRERLQQDLNRQAIQAKITSLMQEGEVMLNQRRYSEAIQVFENVVKLDKSGAGQTKLDSARRGLERMQRGARLFAEARREAQQGNLTSAYQAASAAAETDPNNTDAALFAKRLAEEIEERERERRIEEAVQSAVRHSAVEDYGTALHVLDAAINEYGFVFALTQARDKVVELQAESERKRREKKLDETFEGIRSAVQTGKLDAARQGVNLLISDFSDVPGVLRRAEEFNDEIARRQQELHIAAAEQEVRELARHGRFAEARAIVEPLASRYRGDRKLQLVIDTLAKVERADGIARATENIGRLRKESKLAEALDAANAALNQFRDHAPFRELATQIENELRESQRRALIANAIEQANAVMQADAAEAASVLRSALAKVGREKELERLLAQANAAVERQAEQRAVNELLANGQALAASGQWRKALEHYERAIATFPNRNELKDAAKDARAELHRIERAERLNAAVQNIENSIEARDWRRFDAALKSARNEFANEARIEELQAEGTRRQDAEALANLDKSVRQAFASDDLDVAARQLSSAAGRFKSDKLWQSLDVELQRRKKYVGALQKAQKLEAESRFTEAEEVLGTAAQIPIADQRAEQLLRNIVEKRQRAEAEARERLERERVERERKQAEERARQEAEARERARLEQERKEQERKAAEARERLERERKEAEAREQARIEQERKDAAERARVEAEARERARIEQERKRAEEQARQEAEAQERARIERERKEQERKNAEARERERIERERVERERKEAEAREQARIEQERKEAAERARVEAEARERARLQQERKEQERKAAEARERERVERERVERERKEADARERARLEKERKDRERKAAEARDRAEKERKEQQHKEQERKAAEERERAARIAQQHTPPTLRPDPSRGAAASAHAAAAPAVDTSGREVGNVDAIPAALPEAVPLYRKPAVIAPAALAVAAMAYFAFRPSQGPPPTEISLRPSPAGISLTAQAGANAPASADVSLGSVNMPYRARATAPWMTVTPDSGDRLETLHVNVNASGLKPATYDGQIEIAPADASKFKLANATIPVHLAVKAEPVSLRLQPQTLQFEYRDGGPMPRPKQVAVDPNLMPSLQTHWENPKEANWARVDRKSDGLSIAVQPYKGMTVGTHSATLVVELPGAVNSPQHVAVSLKVSSALGPIKIP